MSAYLQHLVIIILLAGLVACNGNSSDEPVDSGNELLTALSSLEGQYTLEEGTQNHVYSELEKLDVIVNLHDPNTIIPELVDCLDDMSETRSTVNGKPVVRGVICHEALSLLVYYEPTASSGDIAMEWPGHIVPTASGEELIAAKEAWSRVVEEKSYISL